MQIVVYFILHKCGKNRLLRRKQMDQLVHDVWKIRVRACWEKCVCVYLSEKCVCASLFICLRVWNKDVRVGIARFLDLVFLILLPFKLFFLFSVFVDYICCQSKVCKVVHIPIILKLLSKLWKLVILRP